MDAEATISRQEAAASGYLAIGLIGNSCLHGIVLVLLPPTTLVDRHGNSNRQFAICIERSSLLGLLICTICQGVIATSLGVFRRGVVSVSFLIAPPIMRSMVDAVLDLRVSDWLAKE